MDGYDDKLELSDCFSWAVHYEDEHEPRFYPTCASNRQERRATVQSRSVKQKDSNVGKVVVDFGTCDSSSMFLPGVD